MVSVHEEKLSAVVEALDRSSIEKPADSMQPSARFVLQLRSGTATAEDATAIQQALGAHLEVDVNPYLTDAAPNLLLLRFPTRVSRNDYALSFEVAYRLIDAFDLANAEPEVFTDIDSEPSESRAGSATESPDDFPPGCWAPSDPRVDQDKQWALKKMNVPAAWALSPPGRDRGQGIIIAQPDTGITSHGELANVPMTGGIDLLGGDNDPTDPMNAVIGNNGHGTATASVVVSRETGSVDDVVGSAPKATHMPIRAIASVVRVSQLNVAEAINHAVDNGAHVITMSLGGAPSISLWFALRRAVRNNLIVLAAAGNCVKKVVYPARYENCLAIAGSNIDDAPWRGSCRGATVAVTAPGENVWRASAKRVDGEPRFGTGQGQGTSFAVALTAGVAACWLAHHGRDTLIAEAGQRGETLQEMFSRLVRATARRVNGWDVFDYGPGIVDAAALLQADLGLGAGESLNFVAAETAPGDSVKALAFELSGDLAVLDENIDWDVYGPEISIALFQRRKGVEPSRRAEEVAPMAIETAARPELSPTLAGLTGGTRSLRKILNQ